LHQIDLCNPKTTSSIQFAANTLDNTLSQAIYSPLEDVHFKLSANCVIQIGKSLQIFAVALPAQ
jgi:hypothetical protein